MMGLGIWGTGLWPITPYTDNNIDEVLSIDTVTRYILLDFVMLLHMNF